MSDATSADFPLVIGEVFVIMASLIVIGVTWAAAHGRLPKNGGIGIRTPGTMASAAAWRAGHRAAFPWCLLTCALSVGAQTSMLVFYESGHGFAAAGFFPFLGDAILVVGLLVSAVIADRSATNPGAVRDQPTRGVPHHHR